MNIMWYDDSTLKMYYYLRIYLHQFYFDNVWYIARTYHYSHILGSLSSIVWSVMSILEGSVYLFTTPLFNHAMPCHLLSPHMIYFFIKIIRIFVTYQLLIICLAFLLPDRIVSLRILMIYLVPSSSICHLARIFKYSYYSWLVHWFNLQKIF